jgi:hypothetical protein
LRTTGQQGRTVAVVSRKCCKRNLNFEEEEHPSVPAPAAPFGGAFLFVGALGARPWHWVEEESDWTPEDYCSTAPPPANSKTAEGGCRGRLNKHARSLLFL